MPNCRIIYTLSAMVIGVTLAACGTGPKATTATDNVVVAPTPAPVQRQYAIETLLGSLRLQGSEISPDGRTVLFSSNQTGVINLYEVPIEGGKPKALTQSTTNSHYVIRYFPND